MSQPVILDVRERDEFEAEHVEHSINVPLSHFPSAAPGVLSQLQGRPMTILCRSGVRARMAFDQIKGLGFDSDQAGVYEGGILRWKEAGLPTVVRARRRLSIMRQVQLTVGTGILGSLLAGLYLSPGFLALTALFGGGLTFAGATGFCGMAELLSRAPWNKLQPHAKETL